MGLYVESRIKGMYEICSETGITDRQAVLVMRLPFHDVPLNFDKEEYPRQIGRLKTMRRLLQEMKDVLDKY